MLNKEDFAVIKALNALGAYQKDIAARSWVCIQRQGAEPCSANVHRSRSGSADAANWIATKDSSTSC